LMRTSLEAKARKAGQELRTGKVDSSGANQESQPGLESVTRRKSEVISSRGWSPRLRTERVRDRKRVFTVQEEKPEGSETHEGRGSINGLNPR
jgi:hypothetical protein